MLVRPWRQLTGPGSTPSRQAAYDLGKLRGKNLVERQGESHRYHSNTQATRTISALITLREHGIAPIIADVRRPRLCRKPAAWTPVDRDYEAPRIDMQNLFTHLGIISINATAAA